jgi:hypothetical protein
MFAEYLSEKLLLRLPHRMLTFTIPKMLRVFFRHDRKLFAELSILIFELVQEFFSEAAGTAIENGAILAYQTFGEFLRCNPHVHAIILEGGFDSAGRFIHIPFGQPSAMTECFRRNVVKLFLSKKLIAPQMAENLLTWRHSGFSIDASVRISPTDKKQREALAQYIARPALSLKKIPFQQIDGKIAFHTDYNQYFKENFKLFSPTDFIAELTQHVPPRGVQYIRRYGLYSSRGRGVWKTKPYLVPLAPEGGSQIDTGLPASPQPQPSIPTADSKSAWARLIAKIYEVDPLTCDTAEVKKILRHLVNIGKPPLGRQPFR